MGIYQIINLINHKSYVGQSIDIKRRWRTHRKYAKRKEDNFNKYPIYRAIKKNGIENFEFKILEIVDDKEKLLERETFWYDKLKPEYNLIEPRFFQFKTIDKVYQLDYETLNIVNIFEYAKDAMRKTNINDSSILDCCRNKIAHAGGYRWCFEKDYKKGKVFKKNTRGKILQIDIKTKNVIREFNSMREAADYFGVHHGSISRACNKINSTSCGFEWKRVNQKVTL